MAIQKETYVGRLFLKFTTLKKSPKIILVLLFSIFFSFLLVRNNFDAKWGIIDDHEITSFLGSDKKILLSEFSGIILKTEVGSFGTYLRYRPSYYVLKVAEAFLWKDNTQLWYFARYSILVLFLFTVPFLVTKYFGIIPSIVFGLYIMTGEYWTDIWTRLGPAEIYMVLGLSLYFLGLLKIFEEKVKPGLPLVLFLLGSLIAIGSKENMVILAVPSLYLVINRVIHRKWDLRMVPHVLVISFSLLIFISIYLGISKTGQDVYAGEITSSKTLQLIITGFIKSLNDLKIIWIFAAGALLSILKIFSSKKYDFAIFFANHRQTIYLLAFLFLMYFSQFVYYSGAWPTGMRYDFPGILVKQVFWLACLYLLIKYINNAIFLKRHPKIYLLNIIKIVFFGSLCFVVFNKGYLKLINASHDNMLVTSMFTAKLASLSDIAKANPNNAIVIDSGDPGDYERIFSLQRFLRYMGVTNPIYLNYVDINLVRKSGLEKKLSEELTQISTNGLKRDTVLFIDFNSKNINVKCIQVLLTKAEDNNKCEFKYPF
jgi:hypothetical protein